MVTLLHREKGRCCPQQNCYAISHLPLPSRLSSARKPCRGPGQNVIIMAKHPSIETLQHSPTSRSTRLPLIAFPSSKLLPMLRTVCSPALTASTEGSLFTRLRCFMALNCWQVSQKVLGPQMRQRGKHGRWRRWNRQGESIYDEWSAYGAENMEMEPRSYNSVHHLFYKQFQSQYLHSSIRLYLHIYLSSPIFLRKLSLVYLEI